MRGLLTSPCLGAHAEMAQNQGQDCLSCDQGSEEEEEEQEQDVDPQSLLQDVLAARSTQQQMEEQLVRGQLAIVEDESLVTGLLKTTSDIDGDQMPAVGHQTSAEAKHRGAVPEVASDTRTNSVAPGVEALPGAAVHTAVAAGSACVAKAIAEGGALVPASASPRDIPHISNNDFQRDYDTCFAKPHEQVLGEGSEGRIVAALQRSTGQLFALKRLKQQMGARDMDVQQAVFRCPHPNLAHVLAIIVSDKPIGLLYPYMDEDVDAYWRRHFKFLPVPEIVRIVHGTLAGVKHLHSIHLIHRDIKQSNVLLTFGAYRRVCLSDFGWCRGFHSESEGTTLMTRDAVTVTYRAPEIFLGSRSYDTSIDVWSCGIMLLELLRGARFITDVRKPPLGYIEKLVGPINESSWPGCSKLPKWACQRALIDAVPPKAWLAPFKGGRKGVDAEGELLASWMLALPPCQRITAAQAINSQFVLRHLAHEAVHNTESSGDAGAAGASAAASAVNSGVSVPAVAVDSAAQQAPTTASGEPVAVAAKAPPASSAVAPTSPLSAGTSAGSASAQTPAGLAGTSIGAEPKAATTEPTPLEAPPRAATAATSAKAAPAASTAAPKASGAALAAATTAVAKPAPESAMDSGASGPAASGAEPPIKKKGIKRRRRCQAVHQVQKRNRRRTADSTEPVVASERKDSCGAQKCTKLKRDALQKHRGLRKPKRRKRAEATTGEAVRRRLRGKTSSTQTPYTHSASSASLRAAVTDASTHASGVSVPAVIGSPKKGQRPQSQLADQNPCQCKGRACLWRSRSHSREQWLTGSGYPCVFEASPGYAFCDHCRCRGEFTCPSACETELGTCRKVQCVFLRLPRPLQAMRDFRGSLVQRDPIDLESFLEHSAGLTDLLQVCLLADIWEPAACNLMAEGFKQLPARYSADDLAQVLHKVARAMSPRLGYYAMDDVRRSHLKTMSCGGRHPLLVQASRDCG